MIEGFLKIFEKNNIDIFPTERLNLDYIEKPEYQDKDEEFLEEEILEEKKDGKLRRIDKIPFENTFFKYFLDGSRKVYKISEIAFGNKFLPVVCAQIGVACTERKFKILKKHTLIRKNMILVPDCMNELDFNNLREQITDYSIQKVKIDFFEGYEYSKKGDKKPLDLAIAKVIQKMQKLEVDLIFKMANSNKLDTDRMILIDGSLQLSDKRINEENFRNVLGISKTFNVHLTNLFKKKNQEIGTLLTKLRFGQRTPVFRLVHKLNKSITIGAWYLRIRDERRMKNSLDGIIKIEKIANTNEDENIKGFDSLMIDNLSRNLLEERNVTCYGNDLRWPNHIYPIYLTEKLIKNTFISDIYFMNVF